MDKYSKFPTMEMTIEHDPDLLKLAAADGNNHNQEEEEEEEQKDVEILGRKMGMMDILDHSTMRCELFWVSTSDFGFRCNGCGSKVGSTILSVIICVVI